MSRLLLNCDIGESFGNWTMGLDAEVMPFIDCANIACGFHAGDPSIMRKTVSLALGNGVQIGAHPAYQDLVGFGRRSMAYTPRNCKTFCTTRSALSTASAGLRAHVSATSNLTARCTTT